MGTELTCYVGTVYSTVCCAYRVYLLLWPTLGLLNVYLLPAVPVCRRFSSVRGKTSVYGTFTIGCLLTFTIGY